MIRNYLLTALRNFRNNRSYVAINIFGLSVGIACSLVVYTILKHELTFDSFHEKSDQLYRVVEHYQGDYGISYNSVIPNAMPKSLRENKQLISDVIPIHGPVSGIIEFEHQKKFNIFKEENSIIFAGESFLKNLDFPVKNGAGPELLNEPFKTFISEDIAVKYFGNDNPIGQFITFNEDHSFEVVGVLEKVPTNTNVPFQLIFSYSSLDHLYGNHVKSWGNYWSAMAYVVVNPSDDISTLEKEINRLVAKNIPVEEKERKNFYLQPLTSAHTDTRYGDGVNYVAPTEILIGFVLLAVITLLASILNFINLATAQAVKRSKEIGIRKTLGSSKKQIVAQFLGETSLIVITSTLLGFTIGQIFIDQMNAYLREIAFRIKYDFSTIVFASILVLLVTVLAGFYPGIILSRYNPITALQNRISLAKGAGKMSLRKILVIAQFSIANLLLITTIIVADQMNYIKSKDLGFDPENVFTIQIPEEMSDKIPLLINEYKNLSFVDEATRCFGPPQYTSNWNTNFTIPGIPENDRMDANIKFIDENYLSLFKIPLINGRNLRNRYSSDTTHQIIVNREFLNRAGLSEEDAAGTTVEFLGNSRGIIVGVTENFHNWSLHSKQGSVLMLYDPKNMKQIDLKLKATVSDQELNQLESIFKSYGPFEYYEGEMMSEEIDYLYLVENLVYGVFQIFASLAILIGIFGLYGLMNFMAERNRKAISIRKVFGASIGHILTIFGKEYAILLLFSFFIAVPLSYLMSNEWLNEFYYRISISYTHFIIGLGITTFIILLTVGYRSFKTATANPVDSLRYE